MNNWKPASRMAAICIGIVALAAIFGACITHSLKIEYPVFCKVYGASPVNMDREEQTVFQIPYLTCNAEQRGIAYIEFEGMEGVFSIEDTWDEANWDDRSRPFYKKENLVISVELDDESRSKLNKPVTLTSAEVTYSDNTQEKINVGRILLYPQSGDKNKPLESGGEVYETDGNLRQQNIFATQNMQIKDVQVIPESGLESLMINGKTMKEVKKIHWEKDQQINISLKAHEDRFQRYAPMVKITSVTGDGRQHVQYFGPFEDDFEDSTTFFETVSYLRESGVI